MNLRFLRRLGGLFAIEFPVWLPAFAEGACWGILEPRYPYCLVVGVVGVVVICGAVVIVGVVVIVGDFGDFAAMVGVAAEWVKMYCDFHDCPDEFDCFGTVDCFDCFDLRQCAGCGGCEGRGRTV